MAKVIEMYRGDYKEYTAKVTADYDAAAEVHFAVKLKDTVKSVDSTDANALFTVDATSANAVDNGDGTVTYTIIITEDLTEGKTPGDKYVAEVEYIDADGHHTTFEQVPFTLLADVNQRA